MIIDNCMSRTEDIDPPARLYLMFALIPRVGGGTVYFGSDLPSYLSVHFFRILSRLPDTQTKSLSIS